MELLNAHFNAAVALILANDILKEDLLLEDTGSLD